jgi:hypothetical protein
VFRRVGCLRVGRAEQDAGVDRDHDRRSEVAGGLVGERLGQDVPVRSREVAPARASRTDKRLQRAFRRPDRQLRRDRVEGDLLGALVAPGGRLLDATGEILGEVDGQAHAESLGSATRAHARATQGRVGAADGVELGLELLDEIAGRHAAEELPALCRQARVAGARSPPAFLEQLLADAHAASMHARAGDAFESVTSP